MVQECLLPVHASAITFYAVLLNLLGLQRGAFRKVISLFPYQNRLMSLTLRYIEHGLLYHTRNKDWQYPGLSIDMSPVKRCCSIW